MMTENSLTRQAPMGKSSQELYVITFAASAGGLNALSEVVSRLPGNLPAAMLVVQHLDPRRPSMMANILSRRTKLTARQAEEGDALKPSTIYIAPPNWHMLLDPEGKISLVQTDQVNYVRPSADLLFESVASVKKQRAIAVVLTGNGSDGKNGVIAIKKAGGTVIVQDKETSDFDSMPAAAIATGVVDYILPLNQISEKLIELIRSGE